MNYRSGRAGAVVRAWILWIKETPHELGPRSVPSFAAGFNAGYAAACQDAAQVVLEEIEKFKTEIEI